MSIPIDIDRFARHLVLKEIGGPGQQALGRAHIAIIGAGGLGAPAALYLAAAGVGTISLIDADTVSIDNLQRQIIYRTGQIGTAKAKTAARALRALNPGTRVRPVVKAIDGENAKRLIGKADLVLDGCDNYETRYATNAACLATGTPLISGAVGRWDGQISLFNARPEAPCYRCWVPETPPDAETCESVGVVGALTGVVGSMMALEAIKHICAAGRTLDGRVHLFDGLSMESRTVTLDKDPACRECGSQT